jgi:GT2 family glycosyltransferase
MPNYNGRNFLKTSIHSVLESNHANFELVFVDDCSTDGSFEFVRASFGSDQRLVLARNEANLGAAAAKNKAVALSRGEILIFLDNDTEVEPTLVDELLRALGDESISGAEAKVMDFGQRSMIQHLGVVLVPFTAWALARGGGEIDRGQWDRPEEVLALTTCLAIRKPVFEALGGFDERLMVHSEDIDFSWRMWLARYRTISAPEARVYHKNKSIAERNTMNSNEYEVTFYLERNALRITLKNLGLLRLIISVPEGLAISLALGTISLLRTRSGLRLRAVIRALIWNSRFLKDTLKERGRVQESLRRASDRWILRRITDRRPFAFHIRQYLRASAN